MTKRALLTLCFLSLSATILASPTRLINYSQLIDSLVMGNSVRAVVQFGNCVPNVTGVVSSLKFSNWNRKPMNTSQGILRDGVATSIAMEISDPERKAFFLSYVRLRVFNDSQSELLSENHDPKDYTTLSNITFLCGINQGDTDKQGLSLFVQ